MLNSLYATPSHGVAFFVSGAQQFNTSCTLPYSLEISQQSFTIPANASLIWSLNDEGARYSTSLKIYLLPDQTHVLQVDCEGHGQFHLSDDKITIDWRSGGTDSSHYFQTIAMSLWLEMQGILCIHANALEYNGKTIALIGPSGMGKSTLSAYLQANGFNWLTDDMLAIHKQEMIYPSWPKARMWPDSVQNVTQESAESLNKVHQRFNKRELDLPKLDTSIPKHLDAIFLLNREGANLKNIDACVNLRQVSATSHSSSTLSAHISSINSSIAFMALLQNSMLGSAYSPLGLETARLRSLSALIQKVPVQQLNYANNYATLASVKELLIQNLGTK